MNYVSMKKELEQQSFCNITKNLNKTNLNSNQTSWIIDSGASMHMCNSQNLVSNYIKQRGQNVVISDGSKIPIHGYGAVQINLRDENNRHVKLTLKNVAVVPQLSVNLISIRALASSNASITFTKDSCFLHQNNNTISLGKISNSLYSLTQFSNESKLQTHAMSCIHEWHRKMSHRNIAHIKKIAETLKIKIDKCNCPPDCIACLKGKFHALPFPQKSEKPENPRDIIVTDVCGPLRVASIGGSRYFITFTCANSDYTKVVAIRNKSECKIELMKYIQNCKTQFGKFPKTIRADRGGGGIPR